MQCNEMRQQSTSRRYIEKKQLGCSIGSVHEELALDDDTITWQQPVGADLNHIARHKP